MSPASPSMSAVNWLLLVILSLLWGGSFFFAKIAVTELPPLTVAFGRVSIAAAILALLIKATGHRWPTGWAAWRAFATMGLLNNVIPFSLFFWGQTYIESGLAAILNATTPLFTVIVAHLFTRDDKLSRGRVAGIVIGFAGVVVMIGPDLLRDLGANVAAQLACLVGALSYGFAGVYGRRFGSDPPLIVAGGQLTASTVMLLPVVALIDQPWTIAMPAPVTLGALFALATISTALGYILFFRILAAAGATNISLVTFLIPVSAILLGATFLDETLAARHIAGMVAIALGLAAIDGRLIRMAKSPG